MKPAFDSELSEIATGLLDHVSELRDRRRSLVVGRTEEHESLTELSASTQHGLCGSAKPDGDGILYRRRMNRALDLVKSSLEVNVRSAPELAQYLDLFTEQCGAIRPGRAERSVVTLVPAKSHAEPKASAAHNIQNRGLLGDEDGLPLRKNQNSGDEAQCPGRCSDVRKGDEYLADRITWAVPSSESGESDRSVAITWSYKTR